jgi:hypothetical protein
MEMFKNQYLTNLHEIFTDIEVIIIEHMHMVPATHTLDRDAI